MKAIYAIGDLHGRYDVLITARNMIKADAKKRGYDECTVVYLGDYIDRGPQSYEVVEALATTKMEDFKEVFLKGNHEDILLKALYGQTGHDRSLYRDMWLNNGGVSTLLSYGFTPSKPQGWELKMDPMARALNPSKWDWSNIAHEFPKHHREFYERLTVKYHDGNLFFVHAGADPRMDLFSQSEQVYLWIREKCYRHQGAFVDKNHRGKEFKIVHGHTPVRYGPESYHNRVNLDTGCVFTGKTYIGVFAEDGERFIETPQMNNKEAVDRLKNML